MRLTIRGAQVNNYYSWYPQDSTALKLSVAGLFTLTLLKTIQALQVELHHGNIFRTNYCYRAITWINRLLYMRDPAGTTALQREWYQLVNIPLVRTSGIIKSSNILDTLHTQGAVIAAYVQSYYCYRLCVALSLFSPGTYRISAGG
jgi:hypothetical protein